MVQLKNNIIENALYLVPTPIGNLEDITLRAINVLKSVDIIACEDTRHSGMLLKHLDIIGKKLESYHNNNEREKAEQLIKNLLSGLSVAIITDAGSPGISDPSYRLVNLAIKSEIKVIALPGSTAFVPALVASGMAVDCFKFLGFPPQKKGRQTFIKNALNEVSTTIMYESPYRVIKLVSEIISHGYSERLICIARDISKIHEEYIRGTCSEVLQIMIDHKNLKGEFVVVIEGNKE